MTEAEWMAAIEPTPMLTFLDLSGLGSNRKCRLFAAACCRGCWPDLLDERSREAVETAERFADGLATQSEMRAAYNAAYVAVDDCRSHSPITEDRAIAAFLTAARNINESAELVPITEDALEVASHVWSYAADREKPESEIQQSLLLRDIFGNPFRPVALDPAWRTSAVLALASGIYDDRAFDRLPILADALQDAGCDHPDILAHCRGDGPHVRGCWVIDMLLGKS
jgi:hypothetical protein